MRGNIYFVTVSDMKISQPYKSLFYSEEMRDLFTITGFTTGYQRTAYTYFEFLRYINPDLYNALFKLN